MKTNDIGFRDIALITENQMEKGMENAMETEFIQSLDLNNCHYQFEAYLRYPVLNCTRNLGPIGN